MLNATILALNVLHLMNSSPLYSLYSTHQTYLKTTFVNSRFSHFFPNVFVSFSPMHDTTFENCAFSQILDSSIKLNDASNSICYLKTANKTKNSFEIGVPIKNKLIESRSYFRKSCGNITISGCIFNGCHSSKTNGGSLEIE